MNEAERDRLKQELLEHHFGCHADPSRIERMLQDDPEVRALAESLSPWIAGLEAAARDGTATQGTWRPTVPEGTPARLGFWRRPGFRAASAAAVAAALLLVTGIQWIASWVSLEVARDQPSRLRLRDLTATASGEFSAEVTSLNGHSTLCPASLTWKAFDAQGIVRDSGTVDSDGLARLQIKMQDPPVKRLEVKLNGSDAALALPLESEASKGVIAHLATNKSLYQQGEIVYWRAVILEREGLVPCEGHYLTRIVSPRAEILALSPSTAEEGVISGSYGVNAELSGGRYAIEIRDAMDAFTVERLEFLVNTHELPTFHCKIQLDQESYSPGGSGTASLAVTRTDGKPLQGATATASVILDATEVWSGNATLDDGGHGRYSFTLPTEVSKGEARFSAIIQDGSAVETTIKAFLVTTGKISLRPFPEGGDLVAGKPARVYFDVVDSVGRACSASGRIKDDEGREVGSFDTAHQGRGRVSFLPREGRSYRFEIQEPSGQEAVPLPTIRANGLVLEAQGEGIPTGAPLKCRVHAGLEETWLLAVSRGGTVVALESGVGTKDVRLELDPSIFGVLRVTLFDQSQRPSAERLIHRASGRGITVETRFAHEELPPGGRQKATLLARDESGAAVKAVLGVSVVDQSVAAKSGVWRVGLADHVGFAGDVEDLEDVEEFLDGQDSERNIDLLLGTLGWRRFCWKDPLAFVAAKGDAARRRLLLDGQPFKASVADSGTEASGLMAKAFGDERRALKTLRFSAIAVVLALLVGLALPYGRATWQRTFGLRNRVALACLSTIALGLLVALRPDEDHSERETNQFRAIPESVSMVSGLRLDRQGDAIPLMDLSSISLGTMSFSGIDLSRYVRDFDVEIAQAAVVADPIIGLMTLRNHVALQLEPMPNPSRLPLRINLGAFESGFLFRSIGTLEREFAHKRGSQSSRSQFVESVYWNALLRTDETGRAEFEFDTGDQVSSWELWTDAHGSGRIGQSTASFVTRLPLSIRVRAPLAVSAGDRIDLPVTVTRDEKTQKDAKLRVSVDGGLSSEGPSEQDVLIDGTSTRVFVPVAVVASSGKGTLKVEAQTGEFKDSLQREIAIHPRGFPRSQPQSGMTREGRADVVLRAPTSVEDQSLRATLKFYPGPLSTILDGLEGMIGEPSGCFEQTSSVNYPNVLALSLLSSIGDGSSEVLERSRALLDKGYRRLLTFECRTGGFDWYGRDPGHTALTAYGLLQFHDMSKVHPVDPVMMARVRAWVLAQRDGEDGFRQADGHSFGQCPPATRSAYVTYALLASGTAPEELSKEIDALKLRATRTNDSYELAVLALAFQTAGLESEADRVRGALQRLQTSEGFVSGGRASLTGTSGVGLDLETTALAVQAWNFDARLRGPVEHAVRWMASKRQGSGTFGATQTTVQALRALVGYAQNSGRTAPKGRITLLVNDRAELSQEISDGSTPIVFKGLEEVLGAGDNVLVVTHDAQVELPYTVDLTYTTALPPEDDAARLTALVALDRQSAQEGDVVTLKIKISNRSREPVSMPMLIIGLPAGLEAPVTVLDALQEAGTIELWEQRGRDLVFYFRGLDALASREFDLQTAAVLPGQTSGTASRAWLYYDPAHVHFCDPISIEVLPNR